MLKKFCRISCYSLSLFYYFSTHGQLPSANFQVQSSACLNEKIKLENTSSNAIGFDWDFCEGDLQANPVALKIGTLVNAGNPRGMDITFDGQNWYAFVASSASNTIYRLDFGPTLSNPSPVVNNLGNIGNLFASPNSIRLVRENNTWLAFVINNSGSSLIRVVFGTDLKNTPSAQNVVAGFTANNGLAIQNTGTAKIIVATNLNTNTITIVNFRNSFLDTPQSGDIITSAALPGANQLDDIKLLNYEGNWYGFVNGMVSRNILRLNFGPNLFSTPSVVNVTGSLTLSGDFPVGISFQWDAGKFIGLMQTFSGRLYRVDYGSNFLNTTPTYSDLGFLSILANGLFLEFVKDDSRLFGFSIDYGNLSINRITFPNGCLGSKGSSILEGPENIFYTQPSSHSVSLKAWDANNNLSYRSAPLTISGVQAPDIQIFTQNICSNHDVFFAPINNSGNLVGVEWNFDDGNTSNQSNPAHQFASSGEYEVQLSVQASNGCNNIEEKKIKIYDPSTSAFTAPVGIVCTNNAFNFTNTTVDNYDGNLSYEWYVDNALKAVSRDFVFSFDTDGAHEINLKTSIPGCSSESTQTLNLLTGPEVDFDIIGKCENETIQFQNNSVGDVASYSWDLGDGIPNSTTNPTKTFPQNGVYLISLVATGNNGCLNTTSKNLTIYSTPQANLFADLPPFSCAGTPTQFHDNTASMADSNITSWLWKLNDGTGTTASTKDPIHTYSLPGSYDVELEVGTNYGCKSNVVLPVTISPSPKADFSVGAVCVGKLVYFTNSSSAGITSTSWTINNSTYSNSNPTHTFNNPGTFSASLLVKAANLCENSITKAIVVKSIPSLDFSTSAVCATKETTLTDQTTGADLPSSWSWNFGSGNLTSGSPTTYTFPSVGVFPVIMSVVTQAACSYSISKNVLVAVPPKAAFITSSTFGPPPLLIQFSSQSENASSVLWEFNDASATTSTIPNPLFTFSQLGNYGVKLTAFNSIGCSDTFMKTINVVIPKIDLSLEKLEVQSGPSSSLKPVLTIRNNSNVPISSTTAVINGSSGTRFSGTLEIDLSIGASAQVMFPIEILSTEKYLCVELNTNGDFDPNNNALCMSLSQEPVVVHPYPNPSTGEVVFEAVLAEAGSGSLKIFDSKGKNIFSKIFTNLTAGMNQLKLDLSGHPPGLYLSIWEVNGRKQEHRLIIQ